PAVRPAPTCIWKSGRTGACTIRASSWARPAASVCSSGAGRRRCNPPLPAPFPAARGWGGPACTALPCRPSERRARCARPDGWGGGVSGRRDALLLRTHPPPSLPPRSGRRSRSRDVTTARCFRLWLPPPRSGWRGTRAIPTLANAAGRHHGTMRVAIEKGATCALFHCRRAHPGPGPVPVTVSGTPMLNRLLTSVFGSRNDRFVKQLGGIVKKINALEPQMQALSDAELQPKTPEFRERVAKGETLDKVLPEAFAVCREASVRVLGMRPYDVQRIGGMVLHMGKIAEMRTGEGKTLVATLPCYLNALEAKGVHVVTVNDYLARRDAAQMGQLYNWLGLTVG